MLAFNARIGNLKRIELLGTAVHERISARPHQSHGIFRNVHGAFERIPVRIAVVVRSVIKRTCDRESDRIIACADRARRDLLLELRFGRRDRFLALIEACKLRRTELDADGRDVLVVGRDAVFKITPEIFLRHLVRGSVDVHSKCERLALVALDAVRGFCNDVEVVRPALRNMRDHEFFDRLAVLRIFRILRDKVFERQSVQIRRRQFVGQFIGIERAVRIGVVEGTFPAVTREGEILFRKVSLCNGILASIARSLMVGVPCKGHGIVSALQKRSVNNITSDGRRRRDRN